VFGSEDAPLPVYTVDELVYRKCPSLVIGTVDKFAQLARRPDAASILGVDTRCDAPDLIIQDELHLISGPLGTITGLYEIAIDDLCSRESVHPKIIGSTATIKRAPDQIRALFDRDTFQFPPPVIDASNSCFAVIDRRVPGRLYTGVTTVGRSPKFTLQAVSASLLQSADPVETAAPERDPYWTLVSYFNSLRELGGALVLMEDDVRRSIESYAVRRQEPARDLRIVEELTSRLSSSDIPRILDDLGMKITTGDAVDALLASSMISVGVDIPRLGLMVMNGQPKTVAEYIQATSRVGRGSTPGLVVGIFNNGRTRDRSKFESFRSWHDTLYRDVEATSVTPFASRARDRALHAVLVMLVRHLVSGMKENDQVKLTDARRVEVEALAERILERAERIEPAETDGARERLQELIELWSRRTDLEVYWDDYQERPTLLMSAEQHAAKVISGSGDLDAWATPNSMREVEPGVQYRLAEALRVREDHDDGEA